MDIREIDHIIIQVWDKNGNSEFCDIQLSYKTYSKASEWLYELGLGLR